MMVMMIDDDEREVRGAAAPRWSSPSSAHAVARIPMDGDGHGRGRG
jgi:hypothetical protein